MHHEADPVSLMKSIGAEGSSYAIVTANIKNRKNTTHISLKISIVSFSFTCFPGACYFKRFR